MHKYFGDKQFYKSVLLLAIPVIVQNAITGFVGLIDNLMIGQVGTLPMSGVSISNQLINIFYLVTFGTMSAVGIFLVQYRGKNDIEGIKQSIRFKIYLSIGLFILGCSIFLTFGHSLINLYLTSETNTAEEVLLTSQYGWSYMKIMLIGLLPFVLSNVYSSTMSECGDTFAPMLSSSAAIVVNCVFNYFLIFGKFGFPELGIRGAAIATVLSRFVEFAVLVCYILRKREKYAFILSMFDHFGVDGFLIQSVIRKGSPLIINELFFSIGEAMTIQCYSTRGITAVAAFNIAFVVKNLFSIICFAMGRSVSIMVGHALGKGDMEEAKLIDSRLITFSFLLSIGVGTIMFVASPLFPQLYNTSPEVRTLAANLLRAASVHMPIMSTYFCCYFTMRSGGKTLITFLTDGFYQITVTLLAAYLLTRYTNFSALMVYICVLLLDLPKIAIGLTLVIKGVWISNIVNHA